MVKVLERNWAGGVQRLVVMTEKEYEELRAASLLLPSKKTGPGNSLVEKYLDNNAHPELSMSERLALFNQAVAREEAGRQFDEGRSATPTRKQRPTEVLETSATQSEPTSNAAEDKNDEAHKVEDVQEKDKPATSLPSVKVPVLHGPKLATLTKLLQASGTVSVEKLGLVYIDHSLLDAKSNYFDLMRSLFVSSKNDADLEGRVRFLEHLYKLGVSAQHVSTRSAKLKLKLLALQTKQEGYGGKTQRKTLEKRTKSKRSTGKRPKILLMYR